MEYFLEFGFEYANQRENSVYTMVPIAAKRTILIISKIGAKSNVKFNLTSVKP